MSEKIETVVKEIITDLDEQKALWQVYDEAFSTALEEAPHEQRNYTEETFKEALEDPEFVKFVTYKDEEIIGIGLATTNLSKAPWVSPKFYQKKFPKYFESQLIFYITVIGILPKYQNYKFGKELINTMVKIIDTRNGMVGFDFSENKKSFLPGLILRVIEENNISVKGEKLDSEVYYAIYKI
jgi:ribosomal protein S18 acetylase RimI-like enzyme